MALREEKVKMAIIGGGWVTEHRHLPALSGNTRVTISALMSKDKQRALFLQKKFSIPKIFSTEDSLKVALSQCEAVMIGTDPFSHFALAKEVLALGKHVLMEKPLTLTPQESAELVRLARERGVKFAVVHNFQFSRSAKALDRDVGGDVLGNILSLEAIQYSNEKRRLPEWYDRLPWGLFYDESPHLLYLLEKYGGKQSLLQAMVLFDSAKATPHLVGAVFRGKEGLPATLHMDFRAALSEWFLIVHGEKRTGILDIFRDTYFSLPNDGRHLPWQILRTSLSVLFGHMRGTVMSGLRVFSGRYLCGNEQVVDTFVDAILHEAPLGSIDALAGNHINDLQYEIMTRASRL